MILRLKLGATVKLSVTTFSGTKSESLFSVLGSHLDTQANSSRATLPTRSHLLCHSVCTGVAVCISGTELLTAFPRTATHQSFSDQCTVSILKVAKLHPLTFDPLCSRSTSPRRLTGN